MDELAKISRSVKKASPDASLEVLLVLDAITGQNAISQAQEFCRAAGATGVVLTKLDGTPRVAASSVCTKSWACPSVLWAWGKDRRPDLLLRHRFCRSPAAGGSAA